jgi:hypothetical protein
MRGIKQMSDVANFINPNITKTVDKANNYYLTSRLDGWHT